MLNNKSRFKTIAFAIYFLLTSISFAKDVALKNIKIENEVLAAIKSELTKNGTNKSVVDTKNLGGIPTVKNTTVESTVANNAAVKITTDNDTNHKIKCPATTAKNTVVKNTMVKFGTSIDDADSTNDIAKPKNLDNTSSTNEQIINTKDETESEDISEAPIEDPNQTTKNTSHRNNYNSTGANTGTNTNPSTKSNTKLNINSGTKEIPFADNEQIDVTLSNRDINRILVRNDKIQSVNGPTGLYTAKNDSLGSAYVSLYGDTHFTIFISTINGHNLSLLVSPKTTPGRTIILEPTNPTLLPARFEETESYQKVLVALITGMINNEALGDYAYTQTKKPKPTNFYGIADIKEIASYNGARLLGITSEIKNKSKKPIVLKPSYFYKLGVRAVALSKQTIAPSETGLLYQVIARESGGTTENNSITEQ